MYVKPRKDRVVLAKCEYGDVMVCMHYRQEWKVTQLPDDGLLRVERGNIIFRMTPKTLRYYFCKAYHKENNDDIDIDMD